MKDRRGVETGGGDGRNRISDVIKGKKGRPVLVPASPPTSGTKKRVTNMCTHVYFPNNKKL